MNAEVGMRKVEFKNKPPESIIGTIVVDYPYFMKKLFYHERTKTRKKKIFVLLSFRVFVINLFLYCVLRVKKWKQVAKQIKMKSFFWLMT